MVLGFRLRIDSWPRVEGLEAFDEAPLLVIFPKDV